MKKLLPIFLILTLLVSCAAEAAPTDVPSSPVEQASAVPTETPSTGADEEPTAVPTDEQGTPDAPSLEEMIRLRWTEDYPDAPELDYYMRSLPCDLLFTRSNAEAAPEAGGADYLLHITGDDRLYEIAATRPWYDEDGFANDNGAWQSGPNGAGVDIETAEALCVFVAEHPEFLPSRGAKVVGESTALATVEGAAILFVQAHTPGADDLGEDFADMQAFVVIPAEAASPTYSGAYSTLLYNLGYGWSALEG